MYLYLISSWTEKKMDASKLSQLNSLQVTQVQVSSTAPQVSVMTIIKHA